MDKKKHRLGQKPIHKNENHVAGSMDNFVVPVEAIPRAEEAVLRFFALN